MALYIYLLYASITIYFFLRRTKNLTDGLFANAIISSSAVIPTLIAIAISSKFAMVDFWHVFLTISDVLYASTFSTVALSHLMYKYEKKHFNWEEIN
jgi:uncharacterized membrane protein